MAEPKRSYLKEYEFCEKAGLEIKNATRIANEVPWHLDYIPAHDVEAYLRRLENSEITELIDGAD